MIQEPDRHGQVLRLGGGFTSGVQVFTPVFNTGGSWTFTPTGAPFVTGQKYLVVVQGTDNAGNVQSVFVVGTSSNTFTYDNAIPQVGITAPLPLAGDRESPATLNGFSGTANDPLSDLAVVQLRVQEAGVNYWNPNPADFTFDLLVRRSPSRPGSTRSRSTSTRTGRRRPITSRTRRSTAACSLSWRAR